MIEEEEEEEEQPCQEAVRAHAAQTHARSLFQILEIGISDQSRTRTPLHRV